MTKRKTTLAKVDELEKLKSEILSKGETIIDHNLLKKYGQDKIINTIPNYDGKINTLKVRILK